VLAVQRLLGHANASMTLDRYGHLFSDDITAVAQALDTAGREAGKRLTAVRLRYLEGCGIP
jgi:integrase